MVRGNISIRTFVGVENTGIKFHNLFSLHVYLILSMIIINFPHGNL